MVLLERAELLAELHAQWDAACGGHGRIVFLEGEAGIGKTSVLEVFAAAVRATSRVVQGGCDALLVPRPLAALEDIGSQVGGELAAALAAGTGRHRAFRAFVELLASRPTLAVLEDLHWADEATVDFVRFAARRVGGTPSLIVASYRSDELVPAHPLRIVLGDAATRGALRLSPRPLSVDAVRTLAQRQGAVIDVAAVQARTGGNPFFVTELLAAGQGGVPATVQDAVLARAARLSLSARAVLDAAAILGPRVEPRLLETVVAAERTAVDEGLATGVIRSESGQYVFRHELARQAVLEAMSPSRAASLHRMALDALLVPLGDPSRQGGDDLVGRRGVAARLTRHAEGADDGAAVARGTGRGRGPPPSVVPTGRRLGTGTRRSATQPTRRRARRCSTRKRRRSGRRRDGCGARVAQRGSGRLARPRPSGRRVGDAGRTLDPAVAAESPCRSGRGTRDRGATSSPRAVGRRREAFGSRQRSCGCTRATRRPPSRSPTRSSPTRRRAPIDPRPSPP